MNQAQMKSELNKSIAKTVGYQAFRIPKVLNDQSMSQKFLYTKAINISE